MSDSAAPIPVLPVQQAQQVPPRPRREIPDGEERLPKKRKHQEPDSKCSACTSFYDMYVKTDKACADLVAIVEERGERINSLVNDITCLRAENTRLMADNTEKDDELIFKRVRINFLHGKLTALQPKRASGELAECDGGQPAS